MRERANVEESAKRKKRSHGGREYHVKRASHTIGEHHNPEASHAAEEYQVKGAPSSRRNHP